MNVTIEKATTEHLEEYYPVFDDSALYDHYFNGTDMLQVWLEGPVARGQVFVALTSKREPVGIMCMKIDGMCGLPYLALLGVKKQYRGMGIGKKFLNMFIGVAEELGAPNMFIMTSTFNVRAKMLYESFGFRKIGIIPNYEVRGVNEILFVRPNSKISAAR